MASRSDPWYRRLTSAPWSGPALVLVAYGAARVALIPGNAEWTRSWGHDSSYLAIVARNLLAGRGYVIDALKPVFLRPDSLPVPYHNANPLFPSLTAIAAAPISGDVVRAGYVLVALSSAMLALAIMLTVQPYVRNWWVAMGAGLCGALFPPVVVDSFLYMTDTLFLALFFGFVAALVRLRARRAWIWAGVLLGLTWLTRSAVLFALPSVLVYAVLRYGWRFAVPRLAAIGLVAVVVSSPWLVRNWRVWGSPTFSDSQYGLLQDIYAAERGGYVENLWHTPETPPGALSLLRSRPRVFVRQLVHGFRPMLSQSVRLYAHDHIWVGALVAVSLLAFGWFGWRHGWRELVSVGVLGATLFAAISLRYENFEHRYFNMLSAFVGILVAGGCWLAWRWASRPPRRPWALVPVVASVVGLWLIAVPWWITDNWRMVYADNGQLIALRAAAARVERDFARGTPVVVGLKPYYYTLETSSGALAIPRADDGYLRSYMDQYGAEYVVLSVWEREFFRRWWIADGPPPWIELVDHFTVGPQGCPDWCELFLYRRATGG